MGNRESERRPRRDDHAIAIFSAIAGPYDPTQPEPIETGFRIDAVNRLWQKARSTPRPTSIRANVQPLVDRAVRCFSEARDRLNGKP